MPMMRGARHCICLCLFLLVACVAREPTAGTPNPSTGSDSGARVDVFTRLDQPVVMQASGAEFQRDGRALTVNFPFVEFRRTSEATGEIALNTLAVRVSHPDHPEKDKTGEAELNHQRLSSDTPVTLRNTRIRIEDAAEECASGCELYVSVTYSMQTSPTELSSSGVGAVVDLNLGSRAASVRNERAPASAANTPEGRADRCPFTPIQASDALGEPMKYLTPGGFFCTMVPISQPTAYNIHVLNSGNTFEQVTTLPDITHYSLDGGEAMWWPGASTVLVRRRPWTIQVQIGENQNPAPPNAETRAKAEALAKKLLQKLGS